MRLKRMIFIAVVAGLAFLVWAQEEDPAKQYVHPPKWMQTYRGPYDPDRIIHMTLHEYLKGKPKRFEHETTGRYVTFGIPMKYLANAEVYPNQTPAHVTTFTEWAEQPDGTHAILPLRDDRGIAPRAVSNTYRFRAQLGTILYSRRNWRNYRLVPARQSGQPFPGYHGRGGLGDPYFLGETYCGFDMFEEDSFRVWHRRAERLEDVPVPASVEPPFDRATMFGLPDGEGSYRLSVVCKDGWNPPDMYCTTRAEFNDFVSVIYGFDKSLICEIEQVVDAHLEFMRQWVVEQSLTKRPELR